MSIEECVRLYKRARLNTFAKTDTVGVNKCAESQLNLNHGLHMNLNR